MPNLIAQTSSGGNPLAPLLLFALMGGGMYFLLIRPQKRRARAQQALVQSVQVGEEIVTTAGIYGTVTEIDDDEGTVVVEIAPGTRIRMVRAGIGRRLIDDDAYDGTETYEDDEPEDHDQPGPIQER